MRSNKRRINGSQRVLNIIPTNTSKGKGKEKQSISRPKREARRQSKKLDFRNEDEFFDEPAFIEFQTLNSSPAVHIYDGHLSPMEFQTLDFNVHIDQGSDDEKVSSLNNVSLTLF